MNPSALDASKILRHIVQKIYYNELGEISEENINNISFAEESALIELKDGRYFNITITTGK